MNESLRYREGSNGNGSNGHGAEDTGDLAVRAQECQDRLDDALGAIDGAVSTDSSVFLDQNTQAGGQ